MHFINLWNLIFFLIQQCCIYAQKRGIHHPRCSNVASDTEVRGTTKQRVEEISSLKDIATTCNKESDASESIELARKKSEVIRNPVSFLTP